MTDSPGIPIIRMTVERMQHSVLTAFTDYELQVSSEIRRAVEEVVTDGFIQRTVTAEVTRVLDKVIHEEVEQHYRYGEGRKLIRARLAAILKAADEEARP